MRTDLNSRVDALLSISPQTGVTNGTTNGAEVIVNRLYNSVMVVFLSGTVTDGSHAPKVQESNDGSSWSDVAAADLYGTALAAFEAADDDSVQQVGYRGSFGRIRAVLTTTGATTGGAFAALVVGGHKKHSGGATAFVS